MPKAEKAIVQTLECIPSVVGSTPYIEKLFSSLMVISFDWGCSFDSPCSIWKKVTRRYVEKKKNGKIIGEYLAWGNMCQAIHECNPIALYALFSVYPAF